MKIICNKCNKEIALPENGKKIRCPFCGSERATVINDDGSVALKVDGPKFNFCDNTN